MCLRRGSDSDLEPESDCPISKGVVLFRGKQRVSLKNQEKKIKRELERLSCRVTVPVELAQPKQLKSFECSPSKAALCISFFGMHPTLTHVPPSLRIIDK